MKKITVIAIAAALILWGLVQSPQSSVLVKKVRDIKVSELNPFKKENKTELPPHLAEDLKKVDALVAELDTIKKDYDERLLEYKKIDSAFTELVIKSRSKPNPELIKKKEAELEEKLNHLTSMLKSYQEKSRELYNFQSSSLNI